MAYILRRAGYPVAHGKYRDAVINKPLAKWG